MGKKLEQALRLAVAIDLAILVADLCKVQFAPSTGIIALLTLQDSKKATWNTVLQKLISFGYTMGIVWLVDRYLGLHIYTFSLVILLVVTISVLLGWNSTLSVNVVILLHLYLQAHAINQTLFLNETLRLVIGIASAVMMSYLPLPGVSKEPDKQKQKKVPADSQ